MKKEKIGKVVTTPDYWDCECRGKYIHTKSSVICDYCGAVASEQPDSREDEVQAIIDELTQKSNEWGEKAGKTDGHMQPCIDEYSDEELKDWSDSEIVLTDRERWAGSDHFICIYRKRMKDALEDAIDIGSYDETYLFLMDELTNAFWEGWEQTAKPYTMLIKERKKRKIKVKG